MIRCSVFVSVVAAPLVALAQPHLGFDVDDSGGRLELTEVYETTDAQKAGLISGDVLLNVGGSSVRTQEDFAAFMAKRQIGDTVRVKVKRGDHVLTTKTKVIDRDAMVRDVARTRQAAREAAKRRAELENDRRRQRAEKFAVEGAVSIAAGAVVDSVIGMPQISMRADNASEEWIDAVEFRVSMFDKFGRPASGLWGTSHEKTFLYQKGIAPLDSARLVADVPWHATVGKAHITVQKYVLQNGRIVTPTKPRTVVVER